MKEVLTFAAIAEAATGLALLLVPSPVGWLLLGEELAGAAIPVARVAGMALLLVPSPVGWLLLGEELAGAAIPVARVAGMALVALGVACWPGSALAGMLTYGAGVTLYLAYLGIGSEWVGPLLWPAVVLHAVLTLLLARSWLKTQKTPASAAMTRVDEPRVQ